MNLRGAAPETGSFFGLREPAHSVGEGVVQSFGAGANEVRHRGARRGDEEGRGGGAGAEARGRARLLEAAHRIAQRRVRGGARLAHQVGHRRLERDLLRFAALLHPGDLLALLGGEPGVDEHLGVRVGRERAAERGLAALASAFRRMHRRRWARMSRRSAQRPAGGRRGRWRVEAQLNAESGDLALERRQLRPERGRIVVGHPGQATPPGAWTAPRRSRDIRYVRFDV